MAEPAASTQGEGETLSGKHLRQQLAAAVKSTQWSYAIFWSISASHAAGTLSWNDGYYNGHIKTRKITQSTDLKADQMGLQRSEQLRELYESLSVGDGNNQQSKRPTASLSPEDLTDTEWYYLVCMSFTFAPGRGLPGRALATNEYVWLSNAHFADSKTFTRSLLAKSASIQTIVCIPFMNGVLELGTTEPVPEDPDLAHRTSAAFWEIPFPIFSEQAVSSPPITERADDVLCENLDDPIMDHSGLADNNETMDVSSPATPFPLESTGKSSTSNNVNNQNLHNPEFSSIYEDLDIASPEDSWCLGIEGLMGFSQAHGREVIDDFSNGLHGSLNSGDFMSPPFVPQRILMTSTVGDRIKNNPVLDTLQEGNEARLTCLDLDGEAAHYSRTLSFILRDCEEAEHVRPCFGIASDKSSFAVWKCFDPPPTKTFADIPQKLLKKVLIGTAEWMNGENRMDRPQGNGCQSQAWRTGVDACANHVLSERRRREKLNEKFVILRSMIPSISKVHKASVLTETIEYVKELERRVEELESSKEAVEDESRCRKQHQPDMAERTSDNYCRRVLANGKVAAASKRKASEMDAGDVEHQWVYSKYGQIEVNVTMTDQEVHLEIHCKWRELLMMEIFDAISSLHLDPVSVQSSIDDGSLVLTMQAKFVNSSLGCPGMIKQALRRVVGKC